MANKHVGTLAVLIDGDNASPRIVAGLLAEVASYGVASVKRVYGDWTGPNLKGWKDVLLEHSLQPMQQFAYTTGKNATDGAMIIDAMDLLYTGRFSGFCIVSSDSDFTRLASRLREQGVTVYGFGERKTPQPFIKACDKFIYVDVLEVAAPAPLPTAVPVPAKETEKSPAQTSTLSKPVVKLLRAATEASAEDDGWANLGAVGSLLAKQMPEFDSRNYGFKRLSDLAEASGILEVKRDADQKGIVVRLSARTGK